ncbi:MAG: Sapep family Mn(2+)-dependent dipeptidase [Firmicutes bacterium]|nr:Sapep family Mn(2+)-dependent dipeptidase [Bacillota bacterium]
MDGASIDREIEELAPAMLDFAKRLIAYPSVEQQGEPGEPFGKPAAEVLDCFLREAESLGFTTVNDEAYAGHAEWSGGNRLVGALVHLDVVPEGSGWTKHRAFEPVIEDGQLYGRGSVDDKGPAAATLYALAALRRVGMQPKATIRLIAGCNEESGWRCVHHYFQRYPRPAYAFSPDGVFPIVVAEKGILDVRVTVPRTAEGGELHLIAAGGGTAANVVADRAWAEVAGDPQALEEAAQRLEHGDFPGVAATLQQGRLQLRATGVGAHAMQPHKGINAIVRLARAAAILPVGESEAQLFTFVRDRIGEQTDGSLLGIACSDEASGALTVNLGQLWTSPEQIGFSLNIRYPVSLTAAVLEERLHAALASLGGQIHFEDNAPHAVDPNSPLVNQLAAAYEKVVGQPAERLAIGGGTYARAAGNAVAFGPIFPWRAPLDHEPEEHIAVEDLIACAKIYARGLAMLADEGLS